MGPPIVKAPPTIMVHLAGFFIFSANVRDDLLGTDGTSGAAKPSTQSDSGGELGRSLR